MWKRWDQKVLEGGAVIFIYNTDLKQSVFMLKTIIVTRCCVLRTNLSPKCLSRTLFSLTFPNIELDQEDFCIVVTSQHFCLLTDPSATQNCLTLLLPEFKVFKVYVLYKEQGSLLCLSPNI